MKISKKVISALNVALISLSIFVLFKTSDSIYLFGVEENDIIKYIFAKLPYANTEISALSASVLAAYIFYLINTLLPKIKKKREYKEQISPLLEEIIDKASGVFRMLNEQSGQYVQFPVANYSEIKEISSLINFGDFFQGNMVYSYEKPVTASYKKIEYHIFRNSEECIKKIHEIRVKNILLDHILIKKLESLEKTLSFTLETFVLISNTKSRNNGFRQVADIYEKVYNSAKDLMKYHNSYIKLTRDFADCDIWFNPNTRNYERVAPIATD